MEPADGGSAALNARGQADTWNSFRILFFDSYRTYLITAMYHNKSYFSYKTETQHLFVSWTKVSTGDIWRHLSLKTTPSSN